MPSKSHNRPLAFGAAILLAACAEEIPPRSVTYFLDNPIMLEAVILSCSKDRSATRYDAECVNARQAIRQIEARKEARQREEWEAQSEQKRLALRRTQEAVRLARQRAAEEQRRREEAEYLAVFSELPPAQNVVVQDGQSVDSAIRSQRDRDSDTTARASMESPSGLDAVREELRRRQQEQKN